MAMLWRRRSSSTAGEVIGTVRDLSSHTPLHDWPRRIPCGYASATLDIRDEAQLAALQATLPRQASICCLSMLAPPIVTHRRPLATSPPRSFTGDAHQCPGADAGYRAPAAGR
ncbi:hypothetical protein IE986_06950 [Klebsiella pneumoniae]|uniref:Uncharacterized protein n=1 Tax=Klebsiella pneumoniae TaxID=573 RepID=A0A927DBS5_KLEPN|nr:hypothetical protein [Klebsiella pneumoniae]